MWLNLQSGETISFQWGSHQGPFKAYSVRAVSLRNSAATARTALSLLVQQWGQPDADFGPGLRALAKAGADIHYHMFPMEKNNPEARRARAWLQEQRDDSRLTITSEDSIHVPWSLVFDGDVNSIAERGSNVEDYPEFWGLKYSLSCTTSGYTESDTTLVRDLGAARMVHLVDPDEIARAKNTLDEESLRRYAAVMERPVGVATTVPKCKELIEKAATFDTIFHFFGHHRDGCLQLGGDAGALSVEDFGRLLEELCLRDTTGNSYGLVLLNACGAAYGDMDYSFAQAASRDGLCGLISTEAIIPRAFAADFSLRFLTMLLGGEMSIGEALGALRRDPEMWPLSLSYGCYAQPDYRFRAS